VAEAAARLGAPTRGELASSRVYSADQVKVSVTAGGQTIEFENVKDLNFSSEPTAKYDASDDRGLAMAYGFAELRKVDEAAQRLAGTYERQAPKGKFPDSWEMEMLTRRPFQPARLDGKRKK
jgi:hypothetical protein